MNNNNYLAQLKTYIEKHPIRAERCLCLKEIKPGQLHYTKSDSAELADIFYLILDNDGDCFRVLPGSLDGFMGGDNDIILPEDVMGDYTFISLDLAKSLPASAIGNGFAKLDDETLVRIKASFREFNTGVPGEIPSYSFAIPYASDEDPMAIYHENIRDMINQAADFKRTIMFRSEGAPLLFPSMRVSLAAAGEEKNPYVECHIKGYDAVLITAEYDAENAVLRIKCYDKDENYFVGFDSWQVADQTGAVLGRIADGKAIIKNYTACGDAIISLIDPQQNIYVLTANNQ